jgi:ankyrin repeat protein
VTNLEATLALVDGVVHGDEASIRSALRRDADPDAVTTGLGGGDTVLVRAARAGRIEIVRMLLAAGAAVDVASHWEWTALRAAIFEGHAEVVEVLLAAGADPNTTVARESVLYEAISATRWLPRRAALAVLNDLLSAGARVREDEEPAIVRAVDHRAPPAVIRLLIRHGASPDQVRRDGAPILVIAARRGDTAAVDTLAENGAQVDVFDPAGRTALMHAVERGWDAVAAVLLCHGADMDLTGPNDVTAMGLAKSWHRSQLQFMLGKKHVQPEPVDAGRSIMDLRPTSFELRGNPEQFGLWAHLIEHAIDQLGADEYRTLTGISADSALRFAARLRQEGTTKSTDANWNVLLADEDEVASVRGALWCMTSGPQMAVPDGLNELQTIDLYEELKSQLGR